VLNIGDDMEWVREGVAPSRNVGQGVLSPENFGNFICGQTVHFGEYLCDNWSTKMGPFCCVEAFVNLHFLPDRHNRKATYAKLAFIIRLLKTITNY